MLTGQSRGQAAYVALVNAGKLAGCTNAELGTVLQGLILILGADTTYLQQNASILPGTFEAEAGAAVVTAGGPTNQAGTVTATSQIAGVGALS